MKEKIITNVITALLAIILTFLHFGFLFYIISKTEY